MANYKDQGVKNHEIEKITPQLLKFFSLYDLHRPPYKDDAS